MARGFVLSVGSQPELLMLRNQVLATHGYVVVPAWDPQEALVLFLSGIFDLTVICHSVPRKERDQLIADMKSADRSVPILTVESDSQDGGVVSGDDVVTGTDGPEALLAHTDAIVDRLPTRPATVRSSRIAAEAR